jgi:hypothetical protein
VLSDSGRDRDARAPVMGAQRLRELLRSGIGFGALDVRRLQASASGLDVVSTFDFNGLNVEEAQSLARETSTVAAAGDTGSGTTSGTSG